MEIKISQETTIRQIFSDFLSNGEIFSIPIYQRDYSWDVPQWKDFFEDIKHSFEKYNIDTNYWGSILVYQNQRFSEYEVVDGQQRLVTILLFLIALGKKFEQNDKLPLKFQGSTNDIWIKLAQSKKLTQDEKRTQLAKAVAYFKKNLRGYSVDFNSFIDHIYNTQISLVVVDNELESNLLFGRLNTRGIILGDVDLIKHKIFYETERNSGPTNNDEALDKWRNLQNFLSSFNTSIEVFLPSWWETRYDTTSVSLYSSFIEEYNTSQYLEFLDELVQTASEIYKWKLNNTGTDNKLGRNLGHLLKISNSNKILNVIIVLADITFNKKIKIELLELLTIFEFIRAITPPPDIMALNSDGWSRINMHYEYTEIDNAYVSFSKKVVNPKNSENDIINEIQSLKKVLKQALPSKEDFGELFSSLRWADEGDWNKRNEEKMLSTYAIYTLNNWLDITNHGAGAEYRTKDDDDYSIEHILPKSHAEDENSAELKIGNLTVLEVAINNDLGDKELWEKKPSYKDSKYPLVKEFLYKKNREYTSKSRRKRGIEWEVESFDENGIISRGYYLADIFYKRIVELIDK